MAVSWKEKAFCSDHTQAYIFLPPQYSPAEPRLAIVDVDRAWIKQKGI